MEVRSHENIGAAASWLRAQGFRLVAAHLSEQASDFRAVDYTQPTALLIGTELFGVSGEALGYVDQQIRIPMEGMAGSLNVSVACAVVLYEAQRQRSAAGMYDRSTLDPAIRNRLRFEWLHPQLAEFCRKKKLAYPALDEQGELAEPMPRGLGSE